MKKKTSHLTNPILDRTHKELKGGEMKWIGMRKLETEEKEKK